MDGLPFGIIDPDYARVFTQARIVAWQYGYACVMHGSFTRDLDLLLVPWEERARPNHEQLLRLIAQACGLRFRDGQDDIMKSIVDFSDKPHGRKACSLFFTEPADRRWADISIMPTLAAPGAPLPDRVDRLLRRAVRQIERWSEKYGEFQPEWLPPAGDVRLLEDIDEYLKATPTPQEGPRP